jgi:hypothetical protein
VQSVGEAFEEERARLQSLPATPFPAESITEAVIGKTPYARFDGNDYSVPLELVHGTVTVAASESRVRILAAGDPVCEHARSYDKGALIEDPAHLEALGEFKRRARKGRIKDRLARSAPSTAELFEELARRGANLGANVTALLRLLDEHGAERLEAATREALARETPEPTSIRLILERRRLEAGLGPRVPVQLPDDPRVRDLAVRPASLEQYGALRQTADADLDAQVQDDKEADDVQS